MKKNKNLLTLLLMFSSITLLLLLQFLWLRNSYRNSYDDLRKETNGLFRNTIFAMRDSLTQQAFASLPPEVILQKFKSKRKNIWDAFDDNPPPDSLGRQSGPDGKRHSGPDHKPQQRRDSTDRRDRDDDGPPRDLRERRDFIFHLMPDSLRLDSINYYFRNALDKSSIFLPFKVVRMRRGEKKPLAEGSFISEPVRLNPMKRYAVIIFDFNSSIVRHIAPQAAFSVFLTLITSLAFFFLYRSIRTQQKLVAMKNDFISNITHELKTPIATVSVALEALQSFKGLDNPKQTEEYLGIAQNELGRLAVLTDKILKSAIYDDRGIAYQMELVDFGKTVDDVIASMRVVWEKNSAMFLYDKEGDNFSLLADPDHLKNVVYNLIDNALKYTPSPSIISIVLRSEPGKLILSVADNGPGIPKEYRKKIFEKFFRVPTGDVHNVKGYGLGLSYVEDVVKGHKGKIVVEANGGQGSKFIITLPVN